MKTSQTTYLTLTFTAVVTVTTMFLRLLTPTGGYFNFGDVAVVFSALLLGKYGGAFAGAIGSAIADIISGYAMFTPLTAIAKGLEGLICGFAKDKPKFWYHVLPAIGSLSIVATYFLGEWLFMPQIGLPGATAELVPNLIQAAGGYLGGKFLFEIYSRMTKTQ